MNGPISSGAAKITEARSPIIPAPTMAGAPFGGPSSLESVLKRRLRSQNCVGSPSPECERVSVTTIRDFLHLRTGRSVLQVRDFRAHAHHALHRLGLCRLCIRCRRVLQEREQVSTRLLVFYAGKAM